MAVLRLVQIQMEATLVPAFGAMNLLPIVIIVMVHIK